MRSDEASYLLWDSECDHKMMSRQLSDHLPFNPVFGFMVLTVWTMTVAALFILIEHGAVVIGAAVNDGIYRLQMLLRHVIAKATDILWAEYTEDFSYRCHSQTPSWHCR